ncbi:MAG: membrane protein insertion efficiency factor YidD [Vicinamibacterales bacterium]
MPSDAPEPRQLSVPSRALLGAIRAYKILLSPLFSGSCRFYPSCADYMAEAVTVHGAVRGSWYGVKRLARCHPLGRAGYDPVPRRQ